MRNLAYFDHERRDLLALIPPDVKKILEVGCGAGGTAVGLRERGVRELVGIEINDLAANQARTRFDRVIVGDVEKIISSLPDTDFDLILYADILEHLVDPWKALTACRRIIKPHGYILLSVPNVRHWRLLYNLAIRGRWTYQDEGGTLDRRHLRFFTRDDLVTMVVGAGFQPVNEGHNEFGSFVTWIDRLTCGTLRGFLVWQNYLLARIQSPSRGQDNK